MYSDRARRYMAAIEARYGADYLHDLYQTCRPVWAIDGEEEPIPFRWWVEERAAEWDASQQRYAEAVRYTGDDIRQMRLASARAELARLKAMGHSDTQAQHRMWVLEEAIRREDAREEARA